jgi:MATE family multidrug resistance protein
LKLPLQAHLREMAQLATPVMLSRAGLMTMAMVNLAFLGRAGVDEVAFMAAAGVPVGILMIGCNGLMTGTLVACSHAVGRGDPGEAGQVWRRSLPFALAAGTLAIGLGAFGEAFLLATGQSAVIAAGASTVMLVLFLSLPGNALFLTTAFFLESIKRPLPAVWAIALGNVVNIALNWMLVFGHAGVPAMAVGSALATTAARTAMALALIAYVLVMPDHRRYAVRRRPRATWRDGAPARSLGYAGGASATLEASAFGAMMLFAGWFGATALAGYAIALNAWSVVFMLALGLGIGNAVRVGHAIGAGDRPGAREAGWVGLCAVLVVMTAIAIGFALFRRPLAAIFTDEPALAAEAAVMLSMCAWVMTVDSAKVVMMSMVRATGDRWTPTYVQVVTNFGIMVPLAYALAFPLQIGPAGLFLAMLVAVAAQLAFLLYRFVRRTA